ncbi:Rho-binding antiterminator [Vibrio sp. ZSDE26]|uniref:Rho-binding antiterminator n=1 Tax=Vibrio amylolyticus TaxID=2847292 RepID=A0A9X1XJ79_9VIBR|nr:Rho-binding antiterminator [Vibrio amylolyticus]MCK6263426.1 Rho-binding antiterminator [Vibrio amylolyticus]
MISCNEYDYIEIVCLYRYPIELTLKSKSNGHNEVVNGIALDTARNEARQECIKILADGTETLVVLDTLVKLKVRVENPHFEEIIFGTIE